MTRYLNRFCGILGVAFVAAVSIPALAQVPAACADRAVALAHLTVKYGEAPVAVGLASNGGFVEVLVGPDGATWSILITMPNGVTCLIAAGENWEAVKSVPGEGA